MRFGISKKMTTAVLASVAAGMMAFGAAPASAATNEQTYEIGACNNTDYIGEIKITTMTGYSYDLVVTPHSGCKYLENIAAWYRVDVYADLWTGNKLLGGVYGGVNGYRDLTVEFGGTIPSPSFYSV